MFDEKPNFKNLMLQSLEVLPPDNSFKFYNCPIIILFNLYIRKQGTDFAFELQLNFHTAFLISHFSQHFHSFFPIG